MKYKLLACSLYEGINIGDYIQALAVRQFLPTMDGFIERERLDEYDGEEVGVIMNGWFMHEQIHWPPSPKIRPLFVGFHVNKLAEQQMYSPNGLEYLKQHEPIGCRDENTAQKLRENGINAYFSGCMTLTLGVNYKWEGKRNGICIVDPSMGNLRHLYIIKNGLRSLFHIRSIKSIFSKMLREDNRVFHWLRIANFFFTYSEIFDKECLINAKYFYHQSRKIHERYTTNEELLQYAERLINEYSRAELVITSRIHCALPCVGLETPVLFVDDTSLSDIHRCRYGGLIDLLNVIEYRDGKLDASKLSYNKTEKISSTNIPNSKDNWRPITDKLISICKKIRKEI